MKKKPEASNFWGPLVMKHLYLILKSTKENSPKEVYGMKGDGAVSVGGGTEEEKQGRHVIPSIRVSAFIIFGHIFFTCSLNSDKEFSPH